MVGSWGGTFSYERGTPVQVPVAWSHIHFALPRLQVGFVALSGDKATELDRSALITDQLPQKGRRVLARSHRRRRRAERRLNGSDCRAHSYFVLVSFGFEAGVGLMWV